MRGTAPSMKMQSRTRAIDKVYKRRDRYEIPDWQRQKVWSRTKKQKLIDTILRGWKLPKFYLLKGDDTETFEVVDGQQRLTTIFEFYDNELPLSDESTKAFGGSYYKDLDEDASDAFDDYEIEYDEIEDATEEEIKEFFQRLQEGLPLTSAEKLNSVHSKLRDYIRKLTKHAFFERSNASDRRYGYFDIMAKVAAIEIDSIDVGLRYDDLRAVLESQSQFSPTSNVGKRLQATLDFANKCIDGAAGKNLRNRTIIQSVLTFICKLLRAGNLKGQEERIGKFLSVFLNELNKQVELGQKATDLDYLSFQRTINANIKGAPRIRLQIMLRKLFAIDPSFADILDPTTIPETGIKGTIAADGKEVGTLVGQLNERYSTQQGEDLFKSTSRTTQALLNLGKPVQNYDEYKTFIEGLYFLFHEGVGARLDGRTPVSFVDVNTLRTDLQHDVDHGKRRKVRAKKKQIGQAFQKYAGAPSPAGLAPERFILVQANLLGALKCDLQQIVP